MLLSIRAVTPLLAPLFSGPSCINDVLALGVSQEGAERDERIWVHPSVTFPLYNFLHQLEQENKTVRSVGPRVPSVDSCGDQPHHVWEPLPWHSGQIWTIPNQGRRAVDCSFEVSPHFFWVSPQCQLSKPTLTLSYKDQLLVHFQGLPFLLTWLYSPEILCVWRFLGCC